MSWTAFLAYLVPVLAQLSSSNDEIRSLISNMKTSAKEKISTSKELSLLRHSIADELSELSDELVSVLHDGDGNPTLLEDIETLHRNLKELESVRGYIQVIHHGLQLRFVIQALLRHILRAFLKRIRHITNSVCNHYVYILRFHFSRPAELRREGCDSMHRC
jgi:hypothetical protein